MTSAIGARSSQVATLASRQGIAATATSQEVTLLLHMPPVTKIARASQVAGLIARLSGGPVARSSQIAELILYRIGVPDPSRSQCWTFVLDGHTFYVLNLGQEGTYLYDTTTGAWCKFSGQGFTQWNMKNGTMWGDRTVGADLQTDQLWEMTPTALQDEGWRDILHVVTGGISTRSRTYIGCDALRLAASVGLLDDLNGATLQMRFSDDQEKTWSAYFTIDLLEGRFDDELAFRSLGSFMAPGRIFEISDTGGLIRIDGCDAFLNGFDNDQPTQE